MQGSCSHCEAFQFHNGFKRLKLADSDRLSLHSFRLVSEFPKIKFRYFIFTSKRLYHIIPSSIRNAEIEIFAGVDSMKKVCLLLPNGFEAVEASVFTDVIGWNKEEGDGSTDLVTVGTRKELKCTP